MNFNLYHPADQIAMLMERAYSLYMTTARVGSISVLDSNGDIWITPHGLDKGLLTRDDMVCVKPDGKVTGKFTPTVELSFHKAIYNERKDIKAIVHAMPPAILGFSIARELPELNLIPNVKFMCGEVGLSPYEIPGSESLSKRVAEHFAKGFSTVIAENQGVITGANTPLKAFKSLETIEYCARLQLNALKIGELKPLTPSDMERTKSKQHAELKEYEVKSHSTEEKQARKDMIKVIRRSYFRKLFTSTQGTYSVRLKDNSMLITPFGRDRKHLEQEDLVLIKDNKRQQGLFPSRSVNLHMKIYEKNPEINSIMIAHPPHIMAFAVTDVPFDSSLIPGAYISLRDVRKLPYGMSFLDEEETAEILAESNPVVICENDCVITVGKDMDMAFERLEAVEYGAGAIIGAYTIGKKVSLSQSQLDDIDKAYKLDKRK